MLLHIISKSPFSHSAFNDALPFITENDTVILIDDGVYAITSTDLVNSLTAKKCRVTALGNDMSIRALEPGHAAVQSISMSGFVELVFKAGKTVSWY